MVQRKAEEDSAVDMVGDVVGCMEYYVCAVLVKWRQSGWEWRHEWKEKREGGREFGLLQEKGK